MGAWRKGAGAIGLVTLLGCQPPPEGSLCPQAVFDQEIPVAATSTTLSVGTRANARTLATDGVMVDIKDSRGTVAFGGSGPVPAFIYERIPWPDIDHTLFAGLGVGDGAWLPFWLYCTPDGTLDFFYGERTDRQLPFYQNVYGTCDEVVGLWNVPVELPAHTLRDVAMTCGFAVDTPPSDLPLSLESSKPGVASINGEPVTALVFSTVDCRPGCGSGSWFELHSILWQPSSGQVGFGIWYLKGESPGTGTSTSRGVPTLPTGKWLQFAYPTATWTLDG